MNLCVKPHEQNLFTLGDIAKRVTKTRQSSGWTSTALVDT
jgi:hypothetical protein